MPVALKFQTIAWRKTVIHMRYTHRQSTRVLLHTCAYCVNGVQLQLHLRISGQRTDVPVINFQIRCVSSLVAGHLVCCSFRKRQLKSGVAKSRGCVVVCCSCNRPVVRLATHCRNWIQIHSFCIFAYSFHTHTQTQRKTVVVFHFLFANFKHNFRFLPFHLCLQFVWLTIFG